MKNKNFLLGHGERLTAPITAPPKFFGDKAHPYTFQESQERLLPELESLVGKIDSLPAAACPDDKAVGILTLHPSYLAKSYYPTTLLRSLDLNAIGSRGHYLKPQKLAGDKPPKIALSADIFVAGTKNNFHAWLTSLPTWRESQREHEELIRIEEISSFSPEKKVRAFTSKETEPTVEIVLHASTDDDYVLEGFQAYLKSLGLKLNIDKRFYAGGLCFLAMNLPKRLAPEVAKFSFLRVIREMPKLRIFNPVLRSIPSRDSSPIQFPKDGPIDPNIKVAVFDGGTIDNPHLAPWVNRFKSPGIGPTDLSFRAHGTQVTSALLFGSIDKTTPPERPYAAVDHYRVFDKNSVHNHDLPDVLARILDVLQREKYNFVNLSIGPHIPIEDDDVHMWTSMLDEYLSNGSVLASIAVGNNGDSDHKSGNARVQVPADCVNALSVGACDSLGKTWKRASYSSIGPGRSPGIIKPDVVAFGGERSEPFWVYDGNTKAIATPTLGTSFAAPAALRMALGVRAFLGTSLSPLALKALLINRAHPADHDKVEIGWGRVPSSIEELIICKDGTVNVVYQGTLASAQWLRAPIPIPTKPLNGRVTITATFCFASETDPQDSINYTRSGLDVIFRPDKNARKNPDSTYADSCSFFKAKEFYTESELRKDAHKWETTIHASRRLNGESLSDPAFDIHYNARISGAPRGGHHKIPYALIVSVSAPSVPDLYDQVAVRYRAHLEALKPVIDIPIRTQGG